MAPENTPVQPIPAMARPVMKTIGLEATRTSDPISKMAMAIRDTALVELNVNI